MNHPGNPNSPLKTPWKSKLNELKFTLTTTGPDGAIEYENVDAEIVRFDAGFVQFWNRQEDDKADDLVLAVPSHLVHSVYTVHNTPPVGDNVQTLKYAEEWPMPERSKPAGAPEKEVLRPAATAEELLILDSGDV